MSAFDDKGIGHLPKKIKQLARNPASKEIGRSQGVLDLEVEREVGGIGMGVLSDGTPYPISALGYFRTWLQDIYIEGGKFGGYLQGKVGRRELPPSVAQLALATIVPQKIKGPS